MLFRNFFLVGIYFKDLSVLWGAPNHPKPWEFTSLQLLSLPKQPCTEQNNCLFLQAASCADGAWLACVHAAGHRSSHIWKSSHWEMWAWHSLTFLGSLGNTHNRVKLPLRRATLEGNIHSIKTEILLINSWGKNPVAIKGKRDILLIWVEMARVQQVCCSNESHRPVLDGNWLIGMQMFLRHILVSADPSSSLMISFPRVVCINLKKRQTLKELVLTVT